MSHADWTTVYDQVEQKSDINQETAVTLSSSLSHTYTHTLTHTQTHTPRAL